MESAAGNSAARRNGGVSMQQMASSSSSSSRKEWRVVSEQSVRNEEFERLKLGQSDERLIYEVQHGREPVDVDLCSRTTDRGLDNDLLQQRLHALAKQREELQQMEIELRTQVIARSEVTNMQNTFKSQMKEHVNAAVKFQEQLREKERKVYELERKIEEKERELHSIRLDSEAAWAKEDLIREQNKEIQSYRRERDNSEAERLQQIKQIHDLQEHIQEKDRQFIELQEQQKIAQETILFKDEQIREAQAWITRAQEMDALQLTTNHTLQAELRERTEQYNQLWLGCQRQFAEMERLHLGIQQLQLELADANEKNGVHSDESKASSKKGPQVGNVNGSQLEVNGKHSLDADSDGTQSGKSEDVQSNSSGVNSLAQTDHVHGITYAPSSLLGMATYLPTGQITTLHPFLMHQQAVAHPPHVTQSHFQSVPPMSSVQNWSNPQALTDAEQAPTDEPQQTEQKMLRRDSHDTVRLNPVERVNETEEKNSNRITDDGSINKNTMLEHSSFPVNSSLSENTTNQVPSNETITDTAPSAVSDSLVTNGQKSNAVVKSVQSYLLDERALLACIARTVGSSGRIKISSTLPNRLGRMLAPLHWHDYKKKYGKLDEFIAGHPDLFLIEGDYIQLREGAQEIIAAAAAVAKVAAAAAVVTPSSYSSSLPTVAVTPVAQSHRLRKVPSLGSSSASSDKGSVNEFPRTSETVNHHTQFSTMHNQNMNGGYFHLGGGASGVKILSKLKDPVERNGYDTRSGLSLTVLNGTNSGKMEYSQSNGAFHGRFGPSVAGRQQNNRTIGAASGTRR